LGLSLHGSQIHFIQKYRVSGCRKDSREALEKGRFAGAVPAHDAREPSPLELQVVHEKTKILIFK
jgi:hypothetical protein